jgi:hypothetical protein
MKKTNEDNKTQTFSETMTVPKVKRGIRTKMSVKYKHVKLDIEVRNVHYDQTILKKQTCTGIKCSFGKRKNR